MALLCRARLASMESLMDYDGPWSPDVLNLMIPMAEEAELAESERMVDSVSVFFGKEFANKFFDGIKRLKESIRLRLLAARGIHADPEGPGEKAAQALREAFRGAGVRRSRTPRRGR